MKRVLCLTLAVMALAGCDNKTASTVTGPDNGDSVVTSGTLRLTDYALRAALGNNPNTAAYVTVTNGGDQPDRLIAASCDCAAKTELHTMSNEGGVMTMAEARDGFAIAPGDTLTLKPGGNHIMLLGLKTRPREGDKVAIVLTFEKAGTVTLNAPVSTAPLAKPD